MRLFSNLFIAILLLASCSKSTYITDTPEKFVESMGLIGEQPATDNPLPFFYEKEAAEAITTFDELGEKTLVSFDSFRQLVATQFPTYTQTNQEGELGIGTERDLLTFTYSASLIGAQLKERTSADYEFISATEPDENGITQLTLKIMGTESTLPLKKTNEGYRMFLSNEVLADINNSIEMLEKLEQVFSGAVDTFENGNITEDNFQEEIDKIFMQYMDALQ